MKNFVRVPTAWNLTRLSHPGQCFSGPVVRLQTTIRWRQWLPSQSLIIRAEVPRGRSVIGHNWFLNDQSWRCNYAVCLLYEQWQQCLKILDFNCRLGCKKIFCLFVVQNDRPAKWWWCQICQYCRQDCFLSKGSYGYPSSIMIFYEVKLYAGKCLCVWKCKMPQHTSWEKSTALKHCDQNEIIGFDWICL